MASSTWSELKRSKLANANWVHIRDKPCFYRYPGNRACLNDGKVPTWQANKYSSRSTCCTNHFNWDFIKCMDIKPEPSYKWYVQWGLVKCVQDCEESEGGSCGGLIEGSWIRLHSTAETCCAAHMSYVLLSECKYLGPGSSR